jgi:hypothetical protein
MSAGRYYMGLTVLYPIIADITKHKWLDILLTTMFIILAITFAGFYSIGNEIL